MIRNVHDSNRRRQRKAIRSRAWLNGAEVTDRCFYADDRRGIVRLYRLNADGKKYVVYGPHTHVATEERHGKVTIGRAW